MRPSRLIDPAARLRLEAAVIDAERATAGEIVLCVVRASDAYSGASWRLAVAFAVLALLGTSLFLPPLSPVLLLASQAAAVLLAHGVARIDFVRRMLLPETHVEARVAARARRAFAEHGLARTRGRTGILLFVSLLERRIVVLGDVGVHARLAPDESWDQVVACACDGLTRGDAVAGLVSAVRRCGEILAAHLPAEPRDVNELPDAVVLED